MSLFIITTEDIEDGMWIDEPEGFDSEDQARKAASALKKAPEGCRRVLYRCDELAELSVHEARK